MVIEPFHTWPKTIKPASEPKSGPTQEQLNRWTASYAVADAGTLGAPPAAAQRTADAAARASDTRTASSEPPSSVRDTQTLLTTLGYDTGGVDGIAGRKTDQAIRAFQAANGLTVDGIIGPKTRAAMDAAEAGDSPASGPSTPPNAVQLTDPNALAGFVAGTGVGSLLNESLAIRNRTETEQAATTAALEGGVGSFVNESQGLRNTAEAFGQGVFDTNSPTSEPRMTWQNDRHWLNDNTRGFDGSSLDADPNSNGIDDPYGVIHVDGYGDLPIGVPSTEQYTGYIDGQVARVSSNAVIDHDDWTTIEVIGNNSELRNPSGSERGAAFILGLTGGPAIPYRSVRPEVYNQARIDERGNIFLNDGVYFAPEGSQIPSDFTPPTIRPDVGRPPIPNPDFNAVSGGVQLTQNATTGFGNMLAIDDAGHALTQVHIQENGDGERRAVIQRVTIGSVGGGPIFAQSHYLTTDPSSGELLDLNPVMYPDARVSWSRTVPALEDDRIIESLHFSEAEILDPIGESADDAPVVNAPSTSGHTPAPVGPGGPAFEGGSVFDSTSNVNNAGVPGR